MSFTQLAKKAVFAASLLILIGACAGDGNNIYRIDYSGAPDLPDTTQALTDTVTASGLHYYVIAEGEGPYEVAIRSDFDVYITVRLLDDKVIDSSYRNGATTPRSMGPSSGTTLNDLVEGVKEGLLGMKEGEHRVLVVPPELAYGSSEGSKYQYETLVVDLKIDEIEN